MTLTQKEDYSPFLPLSPAALQILLALAAEDRHGYGIMQEVARESGGQVKLGPGTLYDNLQKLMSLGVVDEVARKSPDDDPRRRYYSLSGLGRRVLTAEIERLEKAFGAAKVSLRMSRDRRDA
jgi:DNA-binding PadR family transcriptional regulator